MKVVGIVAEYNPFHNGHRYHIEEARKCTGADFVVVVMSGDFVQRGEPAVIDKYHRTEMALSQGADLVLELPAAFACASAEYFATGAVSLLHALGCVDTLCFGSECGHLDLLEEIADLFIQEPSEYKEYLKTALKSGYSFPAARDEALKEYFAEDLVKTAQIASVLSAPNNILGIEYIKALKVLGSSIRPVTITRMGQGYHETTFSDSFCSATALRRLLETPNTAPGCMQSQVPEAVFRILKQEHKKSYPVFASDFSVLLHYRLLSVSSAEELTSYADVSPDLADRIWKLRSDYTGLASFVSLIKTKQYTEARVRRALLHILLDLKESQLQTARSHGFHYYIRPLGFRKTAAPLLREIKKGSTLPFLAKLADASTVLSHDGLDVLKQNIFASEVYHSTVTGKFHGTSYNEYCRQLIIC